MLEDKEDNILLEVYHLDDFSDVIELISKAIKQEPASIIREGGVINPNTMKNYSSFAQ